MAASGSTSERREGADPAGEAAAPAQSAKVSEIVMMNAIVSLQDPDDLMKQARERDDALAHGRCMGWMHGFPQAIKDLSATKGIRTTQGSPILEDFVPQEDAIYVERIKRAGGIIIGKTNTPEFGLGSQN